MEKGRMALIAASPVPVLRMDPRAKSLELMDNLEASPLETDPRMDRMEKGGAKGCDGDDCPTPQPKGCDGDDCTTPQPKGCDDDTANNGKGSSDDANNGKGSSSDDQGPDGPS